MSPETPTKLVRSAKTAEAQGLFAEAANLYEKAIALKPTAPAWWHVRRAQALIRTGDRNGAAKAYEAAISIQYQKGWETALLELRRWNEVGHDSIQASRSYYDDIYRHSEEYLKAGEDTPYRGMWQRITELLQDNESRAVLDLGCGPGQFAAYLLSRHDCSYTGVDFSHVAVEQAMARGLSAAFHHGDVLTTDTVFKIEYDTVVCTEVLEHIDDDLKLIARVRPGTFALFSVPSFYAFGHVRYFKSAKAVEERYAHLFHDFSVENFGLPSGENIFLFSGQLEPSE